jgi:hypothetical protein
MTQTHRSVQNCIDFKTYGIEILLTPGLRMAVECFVTRVMRMKSIEEFLNTRLA